MPDAKSRTSSSIVNRGTRLYFNALAHEQSWIPCEVFVG